MTPNEQEYWNNNTNEHANLAYAVKNGMMNPEDTGLSEAELNSNVEYKGKGSGASQIPVFADRAFNGDSMSNLPKETETLNIISTKKAEKAADKKKDS